MKMIVGTALVNICGRIIYCLLVSKSFEAVATGLHLSTVAIVDPTENIEDDVDSDEEDEIIKPSDNLILVGHVQNDTASLEVYSMSLMCR